MSEVAGTKDGWGSVFQRGYAKGLKGKPLTSGRSIGGKDFRKYHTYKAGWQAGRAEYLRKLAAQQQIGNPGGDIDTEEV